MGQLKVRRGPALALVAALAATAALVSAGTAKADPIDNVNFKTRCSYVRSAPDDPIVFPGQPGASHLHDFFGSTFTGSRVTKTTLANSSTTCMNTDDHSAYWVPSLFQRGAQVQPTRIAAYYGGDGSERESIPENLRMIAGSATATTPQDTEVTTWQCTTVVGVAGTSAPQSCGAGQNISLRVRFPECWDGRNLDSADHKSHMAFLTTARTCPSSHPVHIVTPFVIVHYPISSAAGLALSSGGVYSAHADFINGWDPEALAVLVDGCINSGVICR